MITINEKDGIYELEYENISENNTKNETRNVHLSHCNSKKSEKHFAVNTSRLNLEMALAPTDLAFGVL